MKQGTKFSEKFGDYWSQRNRRESAAVICSMTTMTSLFVLLMMITNIGAVIFEKSAYYDVTVEIEETVKVENCTRSLENLEELLTNASHHLYTALDGLAYFASFTILLPDKWPDSCLPSKNPIETSRGERSDITITPQHRLFGDKIWTQQSGKCGERGDQIYATFGSLTGSSIAAKQLVKEWTKYRYGVFDETGYDADLIYPRCYNAGKQYVTGCSKRRIEGTGFCDNATDQSLLNLIETTSADSSLMFAPEANNVWKFCDAKTHDRLAPTKQNLLCDRRSITEVVLKNIDFVSSSIASASTQRKLRPSTTDPMFSYKRRRLTRYVIIIDETQESFVRESWSFLRSAIRKWVVYDLQPNTEVGMVLANETAADKVLGLTGLEMGKNRDLVASFMPYVPGDSPQSACLTCAIWKALALLAERRHSTGPASEVILIIAPGMDPQSNYRTLTQWAASNRTRLVTINFPRLDRRRPLDELARLTDGAAFTVLEQKYNSEKSFLNTYFDLTTILFHIGVMYFEGAASQLPIEIHRKELIDIANDSNSSKRISRVISGNFYLDDDMSTPSGFFIYTHNGEVPLIQNVKLTSPGGVTYGTRSDQRMPVKQITIIATVNQTGPWTYRIERFNGNPQPHFVQVLATPASPKAAVVQARGWIHRPKSGGPYIVYCEVKRGPYPVLAAYVEARITRPKVQCNYTNNCVERLKLLDTGSGDPDITKGDGIYSRYFSAAISGPGMYRFDILVDDNGSTAYALPVTMEPLVPDSDAVACCGSEISDAQTKQVPPFQRYLPPITITIDRNETDAELRTVVGRIGDLTANYLGDGKIHLTWTAPDMGGHNVAKYEVRYALNLFDIVENFDTVASVWPHASPYPYSIGDVTNFIVDISLDPSLYGSGIFLVIRPFSKLSLDAIPGLISNPVRVFVPLPIKPTTFSYDSQNADSYGQDGSNSDGFATNGQAANGKSPIAGASIKEYSIAIAVAMFVICIIIIIYFIVCITKRRRKIAGKANGLCKTDIPHTAIETCPVSDDQTNHSGLGQPSRNSTPPSINPGDLDHYHQQASTDQYLLHNSNNYQAMEPPDHHIVGIPICTDRSDYQKKDYFAGRFTPTLYTSCGGATTVSVISSSDNTLTRQRRMLSPYESWTASQLLQEHECRASPVGDMISAGGHDSAAAMFNYDAPPVPPLPFHSDPYQIYSDANNEPPIPAAAAASQNSQPPAYSTIRRNDQGQMVGGSYKSTINGFLPAASPSSAHESQCALHPGGEKKRRNVTMV